MAASASAAASFSAASKSSPAFEDTAQITLDYNAGTGYEWRCTADPEGKVTISKETKDSSGGKNITGGPLQDVFTVKAAQPGPVVLTFDLVRSWEDAPSETQVYAFTVSDDLGLVLNPYKSNFTIEPVWGSAL